jgi:hypothetical protein
VFQSLEQRAAHQKLAVVEVALDALAVFSAEGLGGPDVQELAGVVPFVDGLVDVYALVALSRIRGVSRMRESTFATSVLPTPASPRGRAASRA